MYRLVETDSQFISSTGSVFNPLATLADGAGRIQISIDDGCVIVHVLVNNQYKSTKHLCPEVVEVLANLYPFCSLKAQGMGFGDGVGVGCDNLFFNPFIL